MAAATPAFLASASPEVELPTYDRSSLSVGIVHIGVGGFHRAHQAMIIDRLLRRGWAREWAICGAGVLPVDRRMRDVLAASGGLYTLVEKYPDGSRTARVIGSIVDYRFGPEDPETVLARLCEPAVRIVSMTITEGAYHINAVTGEFNLDHPAIRADLVPDAAPSTAFGYLTEALRRRRDGGIGAFTVMSCDNMQANGSKTEHALTAFAEAKDPALAAWIHDQVRFPNSMVDRITPATTDQDRAELKERFGIDDPWPVVTEPFFQWVLEDKFSAGRPPHEDGGVQVVDDVEAYEMMKLRMLNAGHQALAYFGYLCGFTYAHEAAQDPAFAAFLLAYLHCEAIPTLRPVPGIDLDGYSRTLIERLSNAEIKDTIARLCARSSDRIPTFLVPVILDNLASGGSVRLSAAIVASWARYAEGVDERGRPIALDDLADSQRAAASRLREDPTAFLANRELFADLADSPRFVDAYTASLRSLWERGAYQTVVDLTR